MIARGLYSLLLYLLLPLVLMRLWWRGRKNPAYRLHWRERLGHVDLPPARYLWVHAVSVGESVAAAPLIRGLLRDYPEHRVLITTTTPTGRDQVRRMFEDDVRQAYFPYDLPHVTARFLDRVRPELLVIVETELWPNLLATARRRKLPVVLANARLTEHSSRGYGRLRPLFAPGVRGLAAVAAREPQDAERLRALGAPGEIVEVLGNLKFDLAVPAEVPARGAELRAGWGAARPVWIAASTHAGEDEAVLDAHAEILQEVPETLLLLVPRHPERFDEVARLCEERGFATVRRSGDRSADENCDVFLGDTLGELMTFYAAADVAFVGGSFVNVGGHNPLEPAALSLPVVTGPIMYNSLEAYQSLQAAGAVIVVQEEDELAEAVQRLLVDRDRRADMGRRARSVVEANRGATERTLALIQRAWTAPERSSSARAGSPSAAR